MTAILFFVLAQADSINMFEPGNVLRFADHMFERQDYRTALGEYERYRFLGDSLPDYITDRVIECLINLKRFDDALEEAGSFSNSSRRFYMKGMIYYQSGNYDSSRSYLARTEAPFAGEARKLTGLGYAEEFDFQKAGAFIDLPHPAPGRRSAVLGGFLSLVPGAGHFYSGRVSDGVYSLIVVSTASVLSYYYHNRDEDIKFGFSLGAAILFYAGSIYGGINAARNYNFYQDLAYLEKIRETVK